MGQIYSPTGPQVELRGPGVSAGFNPVQAVDQSQNTLRETLRAIEQSNNAAQVQFQNQRGTLEGLSQFSKTLTGFLADTAQQKITEDYNLGIADVLNGDLTPTPNALLNFNQQAAVLDNAAAGTIAEANNLAPTNPGLGETIVNQSPAVSGWRAKGRAVGKAQAAASNAAFILGEYLKSDVQVPIPDGQGGTKIVTPRTVQDSLELQAVWQVGLQQYIKAAGLEGLNPLVIAEHVTPTISRLKAQLLGSRVEEIRNVRENNERNELRANIGQKFTGLIDPTLGPQMVAEDLKKAYVIEGGDWSKANALVAESYLSQITGLSGAQPEQAQNLLESFGGQLINPDKPELGTFAQRFPEEFLEASKRIANAGQEVAQGEEKAALDEIRTIENIFNGSAETENLQQSQQAYDAAEQGLMKFTDRYPEAVEALNRVRQKGRNYNALNQKRIMDAVANGSIKSRSELAVLENNGYITRETAQAAGASLPDDDSQEVVKGLRARTEAIIRNQLRTVINSEGGNFESFKDETLPLVAQLTDELQESALAKLQEVRAAGGTIGSAQLQTFIQKQAVDALKTDRFRPTVKNGRLQMPAVSTGLPAVIKYSRGPSGKNLSLQILSKLPPVVSVDRDTLLSEDKIQANIDALNNGGQPSADLVAIAKSGNVSPQAALIKQAQKYGIPYTPTSQNVAAQRYAENQRLDPSAAAILANPRASAAQRIRATTRLAQARIRATRSQQQLPGGAGKALEDLKAALIPAEGGGQAYNGANRGTAGDTPGGVPNLSNMTVGQVKRLYQQGYNALGAYQFTGPTFNVVAAAAGIPDSAKFDKATQDRMFEAVLFGGANNRTRLSRYLNGQSNDLRGAVEDFSNEWAAARNMSGGSRYTGTAGNRPSLTVTEFLRNIRKERMSQMGKSVDMTSRNVQSINFENSAGQPGFDLWFADKQFGAVLPGRVKEVSQEPGYGNYVVVESIDPLTGNPVDVLYGHLDQVYYKPGDRISAGTAIGKQGGTGNVRSADGTIASVDFFAPAPKGSKSMTRYKNFDRLRRELARRIQTGSLR